MTKKFMAVQRKHSERHLPYWTVLDAFRTRIEAKASSFSSGEDCPESYGRDR